MTEAPYDSRVDTLKHSLRVGELMMEMIKELLDRSVKHDLSKIENPEREMFDRVSSRLKDLTYGTQEYEECRQEMLRDALPHHYRENRHHPEHFELGIAGMTLMDLIEMLADWKAATERVKDGDLEISLERNDLRFSMDYHLSCILRNTARALGWIPPLDGTDADEVARV